MTKRVNHVLYLDLGATRIKWVLTVQGRDAVAASGVISNPYERDGYKVEIDLPLLFKRIKKLVTGIAREKSISHVMISSQMHGFVVSDSNGNYTSNYVSWMDQRYFSENRKAFEQFKNDHSALFLEETGIELKSGLPFFNSISLLRSQKIRKAKLFTLPEVILQMFGAENVVTHSSMIGGTGFYNIYHNDISAELGRLHQKMSGCRLSFNPAVNAFARVPVKINGSYIDFSVGYGDFQCAVLGAAGNDPAALSINLGTGSQVTRIVPGKKNIPLSAKRGIQKRSFFFGDFLDCITHIPSGRALNVYVDFLTSVSGKDVWKDMEKMPVSDIQHATMKFDLAIFADAWRYKGGGSISLIPEDNFSYRNYLASLLRSYADQYVTAASLLTTGAGKKPAAIVFSGGLSKKLPGVTTLISEALQLKKVTSENDYIVDEAIIGLQKISRHEDQSS